MSKKFRQFILILMIIGFNLPIYSLAKPVAVVEAVQEAAAFQRESRQQPLKKGIELLRGDIITTGSDARVVIRFSDDSLAKIGAHARVVIERLIPPPANKEEEGLTGVFEVLKGIFRFSTSRRVDVKIHVGHVISAGVRGTDVYTHAKVDKDIVCLIEGKIKVQAGEVTQWLTQPKEGFVVPKGKAPLPISLIPEETFQKWLVNSELKAE
jgi:hypothetical protein